MPVLDLEDFDIAASRASAHSAQDPPPILTEADRIAAYEQGYQAGWDDVSRAEVQDQTRIGAEFARTLQELSFTFHEARAHVIHAMEPFLTQLVDVVLPALVSDSFAETLLQELRPMIEDAADAPVELVVCPASRAALENRMQDQSFAAIQLTEEPSLAEGQAYLRVGRSERHIDLTGALDRIRDAIRSLHALNERTLKHA